MLKFEAWPPQPGAVNWDEQTLHDLRINHRVFADYPLDEDGFAKNETRLSNIADYTGHLIIANLPVGSEDVAFKIADELTLGWTGNAKDLFLYQFGYGVGFSREQTEAQLAVA